MGEDTKLGGVGDHTNHNRPPLLPDRHPVPDFFVCDIFDAAPKGDQASMEHPIFSLSTKPDYRIRRYTHNGRFLEVRPGHLGLATVHDRDVLIFCISQLMAALNEGRPVDHKVRFKAHDLLKATNRGIDGRGYAQLKAAFERLQNTQIETNIPFGGIEQLDIFSLVDRVKIIRETREGRMIDVEVTLSEWVFDALRANEVLTIHRNYFRLRKPLERRLYEIARKHCGTKSQWAVGLKILQKKCGSNSSPREFRRLVKDICKADAQHRHMPDYAITLDNESDQVIFRSRGTVPATKENKSERRVLLEGWAYEGAREAAPGWDIYGLEDHWRAWITEKDIKPKNPGAHFIQFCASWYDNHGEP